VVCDAWSQQQTYGAKCGNHFFPPFVEEMRAFSCTLRRYELLVVEMSGASSLPEEVREVGLRLRAEVPVPDEVKNMKEYQTVFF
jgi:hypothetical protein